MQELGFAASLILEADLHPVRLESFEITDRADLEPFFCPRYTLQNVGEAEVKPYSSQSNRIR